MSDLSVVIPYATINLVTNPSIEVDTTGYTAVVAAIARSATEQYRGVYSLQITPTVGLNDGAYYSALALTNAIQYTFAVDGLWADGVAYQIYFATAVGALVGTATTFIGAGEWSRQSVTVTIPATANYRVYVTKNDDSDVTVFYTDGWQVEEGQYASTYCDGTQRGCEWNGTANAATSSRGGRTRLGGREVDFEDFNLRPVLPYIGFDTPPVNNILQPLPLQSGELLQRIKIQTRDLRFSIEANPEPTGTNAEKLSALVAAKSDLDSFFNPDLVNDETEDIWLIWTGPNSKMWIPVIYRSGAAGNYTETYCELLPLALWSIDPFWRLDKTDAVVVSGGAVALNVSIIYRKIAGTTWDDVGDPAVGGPPFDMLRILNYPALNRVVCGGNFINLDGDANLDGIAFLIPGTDTFEEIVGHPINPYGARVSINDMALLSTDDLWVCGDFQDWSTVAGANSVCYYDFSAGVWVDPVYPVAASANDVEGNNDGTRVWVSSVGPDIRYITIATGVWTNKSTLVGTPIDLVFRPSSDLLYVLGTITGETTGPITYWGIATYDEGTDTWVDDDLNGGIRNGGLAGQCSVGLWSADNLLYVGGIFDTVNGLSDAAENLAYWDGTVWTPIIPGPTTPGVGVASVQDMQFDSDGRLWVVGTFTTLGSLSASGVGIWNGSEWELPGIGFTVDNVVQVRSIEIVPRAGGDTIYLGMGLGSITTAEAAQSQTVTNNGTAEAFPIMQVTRTGGTSATLKEITNESTGFTLLFEYALSDGETVTIDLSSQNKLMTTSLTGAIINNEILSASDLTAFSLVPGDNELNIFVPESGGATVEFTVQWVTRFRTVGGAE
jgi:hypothetical protein